MIVDRLADDLVIPFPLDRQFVQADSPLTYRPWGTRTIKLRATTARDLPKLRILPQAILPEDQALGIYKAYADDSRALHITWGGGHEDGPCVKSRDMLSAFETPAPFRANDSSHVFFNLTHAGAILPHAATITLRALRCPQDDAGAFTNEQAALLLPVRLPAELPPVESIIRVLPAHGDGSLTISSGRYLPAYDSRWWPSAEVTYVASEPPSLSAYVEKNELLIEWGHPGATIAVIEDHTDPSVLQMGEAIALELFAFDQWSVALRVWFFWVDKYIGGSLFVGRHEVPDSERFDMIIRRSDGRVLLAATDLHWREVWARVLPGKILRASLGISRDTAVKLAKEKWSDTWNEVWARAPGRSERAYSAEPRSNPVDPYIRRLAEREATVTVKAGGTEAHIPTLHNVEQRRPSVMTSSDVRLG
jgi:hypothetical protein